MFANFETFRSELKSYGAVRDEKCSVFLVKRLHHRDMFSQLALELLYFIQQRFSFLRLHNLRHLRPRLTLLSQLLAKLQVVAYMNTQARDGERREAPSSSLLRFPYLLSYFKPVVLVLVNYCIKKLKLNLRFFLWSFHLEISPTHSLRKHVYYLSAFILIITKSHVYTDILTFFEKSKYLTERKHVRNCFYFLFVIQRYISVGSASELLQLFTNFI